MMALFEPEQRLRNEKKNPIWSHISRHKTAYICLSIAMVGGIITGILLQRYLRVDDMNHLTTYLLDYVASIQNKKEFFRVQYATHVFWILFIFLMGFSLIGIPGILLFQFTKGVQLGFSCTMFVLAYQWKGIAGIIFTLIPQVLFDLISFYLVSVVAFELSNSFLRRILDSKSSVRFRKLFSYSINDLLIAVVIMYASTYLKITLVPYLISVFAVLS